MDDNTQANIKSNARVAVVDVQGILEVLGDEEVEEARPRRVCPRTEVAA